jgi:hypothetical protein
MRPLVSITPTELVRGDYLFNEGWVHLDMDRDENIPAHDKRRLQIYVENEDVLANALGITGGDYECVMVNSAWAEKSLLEGDVILFATSFMAEAGDIVLIEEEGRIRVGLASKTGYLETTLGRRPLEATERIIGVGVALARRLGNRS